MADSTKTAAQIKGKDLTHRLGKNLVVVVKGR